VAEVGGTYVGGGRLLVGLGERQDGALAVKAAHEGDAGPGAVAGTEAVGHDDAGVAGEVGRGDRGGWNLSAEPQREATPARRQGVPPRTSGHAGAQTGWSHRGSCERSSSGASTRLQERPSTSRSRGEQTTTTRETTIRDHIECASASCEYSRFNSWGRGRLSVDIRVDTRCRA
jgi:hypothetical protein